MIKMSDGETYEVSTTTAGEVHIEGSNGYDQYGTGIQVQIHGPLMICQNHKWVRVSGTYVLLIKAN